MVVFGHDRILTEIFWVGGRFNTIDGVPTANTPDGNLYPTLYDGTNYASSSNKYYMDFNDDVLSLCLYRQNVGTPTQILVGGKFTNYQNNGNLTHIVKLTIDDVGTPDTNFGPTPNGNVLAITVQNEEKILVGGSFTQLNTTTANYFSRIGATDGKVDNTFRSQGFDGLVTVIRLQQDGKILVGGDFTTFDDDTGTTNMTGIIRLNSDGSYDTTFNSGYTGFDNSVYDIQIQPDGKIVVGGKFASYADVNNTYTMNLLCRLNSDGTFDTTFNSSGSGIDGTVVNTIAIDKLDRIVAGGDFIRYVDGTTYDAINIVRTNTDGTYDSTFDSTVGFDGVVYSIVNSFNNLFVGGDFRDFNGEGCGQTVRLNYDATIDTTYVGKLYQYDTGSGINLGNVYTVLYQRTYL